MATSVYSVFLFRTETCSQNSWFSRGFKEKRWARFQKPAMVDVLETGVACPSQQAALQLLSVSLLRFEHGHSSF
jgi:hypothetical protein